MNEWTEADFKGFDDDEKRLQAQVDYLNAIAAYRLALERARALGCRV